MQINAFSAASRNYLHVCARVLLVKSVQHQAAQASAYSASTFLHLLALFILENVVIFGICRDDFLLAFYFLLIMLYLLYLIFCLHFVANAK